MKKHLFFLLFISAPVLKTMAVYAITDDAYPTEALIFGHKIPNREKMAGNPAKPGMPDDTVRIKAIPHPCQLLDNPTDYKVLSDNSLSITAGKETDLYSFVDGTYYINNAPKFLFTPDADFIFTAKVQPVFDSVYNGGAILLYSDTANWAKLLFEKNEDGTIGVGASVVDNKITDDSYHSAGNFKAVYLKVVKSDHIFCFYFSANSKTWTLVRTFAYPKAASMKIGFYAQSPKGPQCKVIFSSINYRNAKFKNFFSGE
ncbi:DUF1349 domain-containing protein [Flavitalea flava]